MPQMPSRNMTIWRVAGAIFVTLVLWVISSLSDVFDRRFDIPLKVVLPENQSLTEPVPSTIEVALRANGWTMMKVMATGNPECVLSPQTLNVDSHQVVRLTARDIRNGIRIASEAAVESVYPDTLTLVIGNVASKRVPLLYPEVTINTREGFEIIGRPKVIPDSVTLTGAAKTLQGITRWYTKSVVLNDVHKPINEIVDIADSLQGVVETEPEIATVTADVQEIAERVFENVRVENRGTNTDTTLQLILRPGYVNVTVRGGVQDLGSLTLDDVSAFVDIVAGVDTLGITRPQIITPLSSSIRVINVEPRQIRYLWRRESLP